MRACYTPFYQQKTIYLTKEDALHEAKRIIKIFNTKGVRGMEQQLFDLIFQKETIFFWIVSFFVLGATKGRKKAAGTRRQARCGE